MQSLTDELSLRFPEVSDELLENSTLPYLQMHSIVHWLNALPAHLLFDPGLTARLTDFADWCERHPSGESAASDVYTIFVVGFLEKLFGHEATRRFVPHLIPYERFTENAAYLRQWVGPSEYDAALALYERPI